MDGIRGINGPQDLGPVQPSQLKGSVPTKPAQLAAGQDDTVEISEIARFVGMAAELPEIRTDKVAAVKAAIEAGTYVTQEKLDIAIDRLLEEL
jgi:anti-sigma28 factor (negative regulator of flagellin synthesis)